MAKKRIEVVAVNGSVKYEKKFRVPGTDSARFKCDEDIAKELKAADTVVDAAVFDAQQAPAEEMKERTGQIEISLELLQEEYPELLEQIAAKVAEGLYTSEHVTEEVTKAVAGLFSQEQVNEAAAAVPAGYVAESEVDDALALVPDGYVAQAAVDAQVKKLQDEIVKLKKK